jgi:hypothetical protein
MREEQIMNESPGIVSANEIATGLLIRGIKINGYYLIVENCNVFPIQEVDELYLIQGGPRSAIGNIGIKTIEGQISSPVRVDGNGDLDPAIIELLENAQNPDTILTIETNYSLSMLDQITAENGGTNNNSLLTFDSCLVKDLVLSVSNEEGGKIVVSIIGMIDERQETEIISPPEGFLLHRQLSFADCDVSRYESDMRTISQLQIHITNEVEVLKFLRNPDEGRYDQPNCFGVQSTRWEGYFEEILRRGADLETYIHGGFMQDSRLQLDFGKIRATINVPLFKIAEQPLTSAYLKRKTEFFAQMAPMLRNPAGDLFTYL